MTDAHLHHTVTVEVDPQGEDEQPDVTVRFTCTAPGDASCRTYPALASSPTWDGCECEAWYPCDNHGPREEGFCGLTEAAPAHDCAGHLFASGQTCWATDWFGNNAAEYTGPDGIEIGDYIVPSQVRTGHVYIAFEGDYIQWNWHAAATEGDPR